MLEGRGVAGGRGVARGGAWLGAWPGANREDSSAGVRVSSGIFC